MAAIWLITFYLYLFDEPIYRSDWCKDFHARWLKWCRLMQGCTFLALRCYCSLFGVTNLPKPNFADVYRHFHEHNIETTALITTKYCRTIKTTKYSPWVVQVGAEQIKDGGKPPSWKIKNSYISKAMTDFNEIWYAGIYMLALEIYGP